LLTSTLDATADGILVVDDAGRFRSFNNRFAEMWGIPESVLELGHDGSALMHVQDQLSDPAAFLARVEELYAHPEAESHDILEFTDGRVFERYSRPQTVDGAVVGRVWSFRDVTDRKQLESRLSYQAFHDSLTGLGNRALFIDRLRHAVDRSERNGGDLAVLFLDMDNVKAVNDTLGHVAGDSLLQRMAEVLQRCLRKGDTAARLGGDEFGIVAEELAGPDEAVKLAERILVASRRQLGVAGLDVRSTVSIGVTFADAGLTGEQLLSNADLAMYAAKESGKDRYAIYDPGVHGAGRIN
jgi:diguanylate cyclase (GGDEF)-like protein/PAS domain S-box-containing protein